MKLLWSNSFWLAVATVLVVAYVAIYEGCFGSMSLTSDSVCYLRMAESIKGNTQGDPWFAIWPVGYPLAIAISSFLTGLDVFIASKLFSVLCTIGLLCIFWKYSQNLFPLLALSILNLAYLKVFRTTMSEHGFIPLFVLLGFVLSRFVSDVGSNKCRNVWRTAALFALIFFSLFCFRYIGFLAPGWVIGTAAIILMMKLKDWRKVFKDLLPIWCAAIGAWLADGVYMLLNYMNTGSVSGYDRGLVSESAAELIQMVVSTEVHEVQAYGIMAIWWIVVAVCLRLASIRIEQGKRVDGVKDSTRWTPVVFVMLGIVYHFSIVYIRCVRGLDALGFRLLYPGTIMIVIGLIVALGRNYNLTVAVNRLPRKIISLIVVFVIVFGISLLHLELELREVLGIHTYQLGGAYLDVRDEMLEKYREVASGTVVRVPNSLDPEYIIRFIRPDLDVRCDK